MTQIIPSKGGGGGVGLYKFKGSVQTYNDLPTSGLKVGDTYNVVEKHTTAPKFPAGSNLAWTGTEWDVLGGNFDLSDYQEKLVEGDGIDLDNDTNVISVESDVINGAAAGATAVQPGDDVSTLTNDAGYIDNTVDDLTNYTKTSDLAAVALSNDYDDLDDKPTIGNATLTIQRNGTNVNTFTANATSNVTANISVPTKTSDITNDSGFIDKDVNNLTNYTLTTSLASVATSGSYNDLSDKPGIPTKTSDLTNDSGFIDKDVNDLTNYTLSSDLASVATSGSYTDLSNKPTIGDATIKIQKNSTDIDSFTTNATTGKTINIPVPTTVAELSDSSDYATVASLAAVATSGSYNDLSSKPTIGTANLTIQKNGTTVATFGANATSGVTANITVPTKVTDLSDGGDYVKSSSLATVATSGDYDDLTDKPTIPGVVNNVTSTSTTDALAAAQGKVLQDQIDDLKALGRFLSLWDCSTGLPISFPEDTPYTYSTGDYYLVETVDTTAPIVNYRPNGSSYTGPASTTTESDEVEVGDLYIYDGSAWLLQINHGKTVSFANLAGSPSDNAALSTALGAKQDVSNMVTSLTGADNSHYPTAKAVADALSGAGNGDMLKATYDPNNVEANAFDYNNFINTPSLAAVATSGAYSDLSGTPTLASVATSGSYNDLSNKPTIPAAQIQSDWTQSDNTKKDYIKNKPSLATVATTGAYSDLSGTPTLATVATSGSYNDLSNKPTIPTVPTNVSAFNNDSGYIKSGDFQQELNAFNTTPKAFYSSLHNALYRADRTATVTLTNASGSSSNLFNNNYESYIQITHNSIGKILIEKDGAGLLGGYSSGYLYLSFYSSREPRALNKISARGYTDYQNGGWKDFGEPILVQQGAVGPSVVKLSSPHSYRLQKIEISLTEDSDNDLWITQVEFCPSRGNGIQNLSVVTKYGNSDIYGTISADAIAKIGGTSSQFLKADGSVDSNTYITSADIPSQVSDTAYGSSWDGVTTIAPSKNAVYDKISAMDTTIAGKADSSSLATVATSGSYNDLSNKPTIPVVDSALSTTSTNALQNKVITDALNGKLDGFTRMFAGNWSGGVHPVRFVRVDYSTANSENGVFIKMSLVNSHGNGQAGRFLEDVILLVTYTGSVECSIYRYFGTQTNVSGDYYYNSYGDIFWTIDTTNKIVDFFVLMHQFSYTRMTPYFRLNRSTGGVITQASEGSGNPEYSSGTKSRSIIYDYSKIPTKTSQLTNDSGFITSSALSGYQTTSNLKTSLTDNSDTYYPSQKAVKTAVDAKQAQHTTLSLTLSSSGWSSNTQTVTATGVTASNTVIISPTPASINNYTYYSVYASNQGSGTLTFTCDNTPEMDITVNVLILS